MVVLVALAKPLVLHELIGRIAQVKRNRQVACLLHKLHRLVNRSVRRIAFRAGSQVNNALAQRNASLGHADALHGCERLVGHHQGCRVGQANVLSCSDDQAPRNELGVLPTGQHAGQIVHGRIRIAAPDALDQSGSNVVMGIPFFVKANR